MKTLVGLLAVAFTTVLLPGQTRTTPEADRPARIPGVDRVERLSKSFPPEMAAAVRDSVTVTPSRSNCIHSSPGPGRWSLSVKPCQASPKLQLFPAFEKSAPAEKPATPRGNVR